VGISERRKEKVTQRTEFVVEPAASRGIGDPLAGGREEGGTDFQEKSRGRPRKRGSHLTKPNNQSLHVGGCEGLQQRGEFVGECIFY